MSEQEEVKKAFRCKGSYTRGTACANVGLPEGEHCVRCAAREYGAAEKEAAIEAEKERTKDFPADRVKKGQDITIKNQ